MASLATIAPSFFPAATAATASEPTLQLQLSRPPPSSSPLKELKGSLPLQAQVRVQGKGWSADIRNCNGALHLQTQNYLQVEPPPPIPSPVLIDVQDCQGDSVLFSFGIAEQCKRHEKILRYLVSGSGSGPDFFQLCNLLGFQPCGPEDNLLLSPTTATMPMPMLVQFVSASSLLSVDPSGRILFSGSPAEMQDLLSILAEFNLPNIHTPGHGHASKVSLLVPYFDRTRGRARAANKASVLKFPTETVAPLKSNETIKTKSPQKKKQKKNTGYNRDIFQRNIFHACESLLSLLLDKSSTGIGTGRGTGAAILSLKKLGPKLAHILTSFSIGIAGTGLAVLLSVACKMASPGARVPLSATRVFNTGLGLGLFWLSWAVNGLRDTIVQVVKGSNKVKLKDEEVAVKVERSMRDVLFRAGALVALAALRFA